MEQQQDCGDIDVSILHISDTHQFHEWHRLPSADILICTGDVTNSGSIQELRCFNRWLGEINHRYGEIYFISGNHDWGGSREDDLPQHVWRLWKDDQIRSIRELDDAVRDYLQAHLSNARVLEHELVMANCGLKIYGSSWLPWLSGASPDRGSWHAGAAKKPADNKIIMCKFYAEIWSWLWREEIQLPREKRKLLGDLLEIEQLETKRRRDCLPGEVFAYGQWTGKSWETVEISKEDYLGAFPAPESRYWEVPDGVDILLTHGGSLMGWRGAKSNRATPDLTRPAWGSCPELVQLVETRQPKAHLYGHHHSGFGFHRVGETLLSNASAPDDCTRSLVNAEGCLLRACSSKHGWRVEPARLQSGRHQYKPQRDIVSADRAHTYSDPFADFKPIQDGSVNPDIVQKDTPRRNRWTRR